MRIANVLAVVAVAGIAGTAVAQPVVPTPLTGGTQGSFVVTDFSAPFSTANWFTFSLGSPTAINIDFNRTSAPPDLIATLYAGDITGLDATALGTSHGVSGFGSFGPMTFVQLQDDTHDDGFGGPWGDPQFVMNLNAGTYSVVVTALQGAGASFTVTSNVPAPASVGLLAAAGLTLLRRRR